MQDNGFPVYMPLVYQHTINNHSRLAVWKIEEPPYFFQEKTGLTVPAIHPVKQLQFMASRFLLSYIEPGFAHEEVRISKSGKPFLPNSPTRFSISHCGNYAAAIISEKSETGIDVEIITPKATKLTAKYLSDTELDLLPKTTDQILLHKFSTLCWSVKETMYKWDGIGGVDFKKHLEIKELPDTHCGIIKAVLKKDKLAELKIHYKIIGELILTWVMHPDH
jgi:phosphopantetheinyl transferase (holo-ACP synthase)